jgi:uncharacterized protein (DUF302 family)
MLIRIETDKDIYDVSLALKSAITENNFGLLQVHNLKETMAKKGVEFDREIRIFEICNPLQAKKVLDAEMSMSTVLPCRISVYQENGKTVLATLKPVQMLAMFNKPELANVAQNVEDSILKIMQDAVS